LSGTTATGQVATVLDRNRQPAQVTVPAQAAQWAVSPANLGSVSAGGLFTAAADGSGLATVTATVGGRTASASVAVGSRSTMVADLSDVANWQLRDTTGAPATVSLDPGSLPPGVRAPGSLKLSYTMPAGPGVK